MNPIRILLKFVHNLKFRSKLFISYILLISIPLVIISYKCFSTSMNVMSDLAGKNTLEIVKQSNQIIDSKLADIERDSLKIINDRTLFNEIKNANKNNDYSILLMDRKLTDILDKYFSDDEYYSANIVSSYYMFGANSLGIPYENFDNSPIYWKTVKKNGGIEWIPSYDFLKMFHIKGMEHIHLDFKYLFAATRLLNCMYIDNGGVMMLDKSIERPVLIVNLKEEAFEQIFEKITPVKGAYYFVVDKEKRIISHSNKSKIGTIERATWLDRIINKNSGIDYVKINGKEMIICFDISSVTGWTSVVVIPRTGLVSKLAPVLMNYTIELFLVLAIISMAVAFIISGSITKPLHKLIGAMKKTGQGDFKTKLEVTNNGEIGYLIGRFNNMNEQIGQLIEENYMTKIREKETEIMALNIQLNPHFLYNALNIINWLAIGSGQKEISRMIVSLSEMLQYTAHNTDEIALFERDFAWLQNYTYIMTCRFEGKFIVEYDIDPRLFICEVPKLFLQPFVENAIIHGFDSIENGGVIKISGSLHGETAVFSIEDNGTGFDVNTKQDKGTYNKMNIGIRNVNRRIKLIYGEEYGVTIKSELKVGTCVRIELPAIFSNNFEIS